MKAYEIPLHIKEGHLEIPEKIFSAIKEQQKEIKEKEMQYERSLNDKDARIEKLEKALEKMERRMVALESPSKTFALK